MIRAKNIRVEVKSLEGFFRDSRKDAEQIDKGAFKGVKKEISFESVDVIRKLFTPERMKLISIIKSLKPESLYQLAKITKRPLKSINRDVQVLKDLGIVKLRKKDTKLKHVMPTVEYDRINIGIEV